MGWGCSSKVEFLSLSLALGSMPRTTKQNKCIPLVRPHCIWLYDTLKHSSVLLDLKDKVLLLAQATLELYLSPPVSASPVQHHTLPVFF